MNQLLVLTLSGSLVSLVVIVLNRTLSRTTSTALRRIWWLLVPMAFLVRFPLPLLPAVTETAYVAHPTEAFAGTSHMPIPEAVLPVPGLIAEPISPIIASEANQVDVPLNEMGKLEYGLEIGWGVGTVTFLILVTLRTVQSHIYWSRQPLCSKPRLRELLQECRSEMKIGHPVTIVLSEKISAPAILGWFRPCILLPVQLVGSMTKRELKMVLLHELAHFRSRDVVYNWLFTVACAVHWFNPIAYLAQSAWRLFIEESADEAALALMTGNAKRAYGEVLLKAVRHANAVPPYGAIAIADSLNQLKFRITMIKNYSKRTSRPLLTLAVTAGILLGVVLPVTRAQKPSGSSISLADDSLSVTSPSGTRRGDILSEDGKVYATTKANKVEGKTTMVRSYPQGEELAQVLGGLVTGAGPSGVEKLYNSELAAGKNVRLTINGTFQDYVEKALTLQKKDAAVLMDVHNGDILAIASHPGFLPGNSESQKKFADDPNQPLVSRAYETAYQPGSTFDIVTSISAMGAGVFEPKQIYHCIQSTDVGGKHFAFPLEHGDITYYEAFTHSYFGYFQALRLRVGAEKLMKTARTLGLGAATGFGLPEAPGEVPDPANVSPSELANISLVQGAVTVTPLQMANMITALANGGTLYQPRLVQDIEAGPNQAAQTLPLFVLRKMDLSGPGMQDLKEAMIGIIDNGTATNVHRDDIKIAGKTGTAQIPTADGKAYQVAWLCGYFPADAPQYAFVVMVEGNPDQDLHGGATAGPIAKAIIGAIVDKKMPSHP